MKNIHILPTDKPSRVYKELGRELKYTTKYFEQKYLLCINQSINQNIYITNSEEFKDGYFINCDMICKFDESKVSKEWITDEFVNGYSLKTNVYYSFETDKCKKIILTTDQDLINDGVQAIDDEFLEWFVKNPSCEEVEVGYGWIRLTETDNEGYWVSIPNKQFEMQQEESKQEITLEDIKEQSWKYDPRKKMDIEFIRAAFVAGALWYKEQLEKNGRSI